jgi:hypothetical protein
VYPVAQALQRWSPRFVQVSVAQLGITVQVVQARS